MARFFARLMAIILAASVFAAGAALTAQLRPESGAGWVILAVAILFVFLAPVLVYRAVMHQVAPTPLPNEGEGAGLAMGAGIDTARRRDSDIDGDGLDFD